MTAARASPQDRVLDRLIVGVLGERRTTEILSMLSIDPRLETGAGNASRGQLAMALNAILFSGLLDRVPTAATYVAQAVNAGRQICFDHGALRTIDGPVGALPSGYRAFARILEPLGYVAGGIYPLPKLNMTGRAFVHRDFPEVVPQFFISELHVDCLPDEAQVAAKSVFQLSRDPLGTGEWSLLNTLMVTGEYPIDLAKAALPGIAAAFGRLHEVPRLTDYHILLRHSPEAAWIATEGNAYNHATERVEDVDSLAAELRVQGLPLKCGVEVSANNRVRQTAFLADWVTRRFRHEGGALAEREVPGSFYEFISRDIDPASGTLDLSFDSGNASGIFSVTSAASVT
jgi:hypothetical protein